MNLKSKLLVSIIPLMTVLIISAYFVTDIFANELEKKTTAIIEHDMINTMDKISRTIHERTTDIASLINRNKIETHPFNLEKETMFLREFQKSNFMFDSFAIYDLNGIRISDTRNLSLGTNIGDEPAFLSAINGEIYHESTPHFLPPEERSNIGIDSPILHFSGPLYDEHGEIIGVLMAQISLDKIYHIIRTSFLTDEINLDLITEEGVLIYSNHDREHLLGKKADYFSIYKLLQQSNENVVQIKEQNPEGDETLYVASRQTLFQDEHSSEWILIASIPTKIAFADSISMRNNILFIITGIAILIGMISFFIISSITKSLSELKQNITNIEQGNLNVQLKIKSNDEIGSISNSFNKMVHAISQSQKNIQEKIIAETQLKEIEKFNKTLVEKEQRIKNQLDELQEAHTRLEKALYDNNESKKIIQSQLEKIKETDVKKDEFAAMISHELKTPLVPIMGYAELLKTPEMGMTAEQLECVDEIHINAERLESLISDMFDAQKLALTEMKFNKKLLDLREFFTKTIYHATPLLIKKQIRLDVSSANITIDTDENRLHQVFDNLIRNAVDFVPNGGIIEIGAKPQKDDVLFYVKDNGIGIPKDKQDNLFKKFYQIDTSVTRKHGGTGLGLAICKGIIEGLGGRIWIESEEGKGTTFYFTIPK